jgi:hypothetical protein
MNVTEELAHYLGDSGATATAIIAQTYTRSSSP